MIVLRPRRSGYRSVGIGPTVTGAWGTALAARTGDDGRDEGDEDAGDDDGAAVTDAHATRRLSSIRPVYLGGAPPPTHVDVTFAPRCPMQSAFREVRHRSRRDGVRGRIRAWQRWTGTPFPVAGELLPRGGVIVDVGCGFGMLTGLLALDAPERRLIGVDVDEAKLARARRWFGDVARFVSVDLAGPRLDEVCAPGAAEAVVIWDVLHHLADPLIAVRAAARWLRPGGLILVKENDVEPLGKRVVAEVVEVLAVGLGVTASDPVRFRSRAEWQGLLEQGGFRVTRNEHLHTRQGAFVPHALLLAERDTTPSERAADGPPSV